MNRLTAPSQEILTELLNYDPNTGLLTWKVARGSIKAGTVAGRVRNKYRQVGVLGLRYTATLIIWKLVYGEDLEPGLYIDHINRNPDDNRLVNLRKVTGSENHYNQARPRANPTIRRGVRKNCRKWSATFGNEYLGNFATYAEAVAARVAAEEASGFLVVE